MAPRGVKSVPFHRQTLAEIANKSDPDDSDFEDEPARTSRKKKSRGNRKVKRRQTSQYRKRSRGYGKSGIVDDSESLSEDEGTTDESDFDEPDQEEEAVEVHPTTGKPTRRSARNPKTYAEDSASQDDESGTESDSEEQASLHDNSDDELAASTPAKAQSRLIVILKVKSSHLAALAGPSKRPMRTTRARSATQRATSESLVERRSARLSREPEDLAQLDMYKRGVISQKDGRTFPKTAGKSVKHPSTIQEESQEDGSHVQKNNPVKLGKEDDDFEQGDLVESIEETQEHPLSAIQDSANFDSDEDSDIVPRTRHQRKIAEASQQTQQETQQSQEPHKPVQKVSQQAKKGLPRGGSRARKTKDESEEYTPESDPEADEPASLKRKRGDESDYDDDADEDSVDEAEVEEDLEELKEDRRSNRTKRTKLVHNVDSGLAYDTPRARKGRSAKEGIDYRLHNQAIQDADDALSDENAGAESRPVSTLNRGPAHRRVLYDVSGPFGGASGQGNDDSDSSDDESGVPASIPAVPGLPPTTPRVAQTLVADNAAANHGSPDKKWADISPVEVVPNINFSSVGGLDDHLDKLKEMVLLPLLYPEMYAAFNAPPPRGVLFHGPPGTGKTLMARALAGEMAGGNKKVTFYMRKGADVMSKWVGEAERQLRLLFDEAKKNEPSIIFFDEMDGLAPVRSSKQDQIHASIVTTLLTMMDGMDNRGQVVVIGATNRPDNIDPAFRRPGRFDRELYFPLPDQAARRAIIDICTRDWQTPLTPAFKDDIAERTQGYGGSDLRALCTAAVLNAMQRTFPQIYASKQKLVVDPSKVKVEAKDIVIAMRNMTPSSARQGTTPVVEKLPQRVEPLLREAYSEIQHALEQAIPPQRKPLTALEEAHFDDPADTNAFVQQELLRTFERGRIFRPRLLVKGVRGMGQKYLTDALCHKLDGWYTQHLDLAAVVGSVDAPPSSTLARLFREARTRQPCILVIPDVNQWYKAVDGQAIRVFSSLLKSLAPTDRVLLLGVFEGKDEDDQPDPKMMRDLFGFSAKHEYTIRRPSKESRFEYFDSVVALVRKRPADFPDPENRKKRKLPDLPIAEVEGVPETEKVTSIPFKLMPSKKEMKAQQKKDRSILNRLRLNLKPTLKECISQYRVFQKPIIPDDQIKYLMQEMGIDILKPDVSRHMAEQSNRPYEVDHDKSGIQGFRQVSTGKFFYNLTLGIIEERLSNGYYKRPKEFLFDFRTIQKDYRQGDQPDKMIKANDMHGYVMSEIETLRTNQADLMRECEEVYKREQQRAKMKAAQRNVLGLNIPPPAPSTTTQSGPLELGPSVEVHPPMMPPPGMSGQTNGGKLPTLEGRDGDAMELDESSSGSRPQFPSGFTQTPSNPTSLYRMSGNRNSDAVSGGSDPRAPLTQNSESTNGNPTQSQSEAFRPNFEDIFPPVEGGSQMPDTQSTTSKKTSNNTQQSQFGSSNGAEPSQEQFSIASAFKPPPLPAHIQKAPVTGLGGLATAPPTSMVGPTFSPSSAEPAAHDTLSNGRPSVHTASIADVLNPESPPPQLILDESALLAFHSELVGLTSELTIEQLEMVDARCMNAIWESRRQWDRNRVIQALRDAVHEVLDDVNWQKTLASVDEDYEMEF